jgi:cysteinyl-tRNA synthetase
MVDGKKMSKSLGNFYTLKDLEEKFSSIPKSLLYRAIRLGFINGKFRESIDFSFEKLEANINTIKNIDTALKSVSNYSSESEGVSRDFRDTMQDFIGEYVEYLEDDFNIVEAIALFHDFIKFVNTQIRAESFSNEEKQSILDMFHTFNQVFGILDFSILEEEEIPKEVLEKLERRNTAKKEKDFEKADAIRAEIE